MEKQAVAESSAAHAAVHRHERRVGTYVGAAMLTAGLASGAAIAALEMSDSNHAVTQEVPYVPEAQHAVNSIDGGLADFGAIAFPLALTTIGAVKVTARFNSKAKWLDQSSSKEPHADGSNKGLGRRALQATLTSRLPAVPIAAAMFGAMTAGIATEVAEGPSRPIYALDQAIPGKTMIVPYADLMPMAQGSLPSEASNKIVKAAAAHNVTARPFDLNLGVMKADGKEPATDLVLGMDLPKTSPAHWNPESDCRTIPVIIDAAAHVKTGSQIELSGFSAVVAGQTENTSAINRVGIIMDRPAVQHCLDRQELGMGTDHAVILDTDPATAHTILQEAHVAGTPAEVISKQQYIDNSKEFWVKNVKPITSVLELIAGGVAVVALVGSITARMERNRRELASRMARGFGVNLLRSAEVLRTAKEGVMASALGGAAAIPATMLVNATEMGFRAGVGVHELLVGAGVAMASVIGSLLPLSKLRKRIDPTRVTR